MSEEQLAPAGPSRAMGPPQKPPRWLPHPSGHWNCLWSLRSAGCIFVWTNWRRFVPGHTLALGGETPSPVVDIRVGGSCWRRDVWWMWVACRACRSPACMLPDRTAVRRRGPGMELAGINPLYLIAGLALLGLAPFLLMMVTSYVKIVVVTSLVRNALGVQQVPPAMVMNGLAIILTVFIMAPVVWIPRPCWRSSGSARTRSLRRCWRPCRPSRRRCGNS